MKEHEKNLGDDEEEDEEHFTSVDMKMHLTSKHSISSTDHIQCILTHAHSDPNFDKLACPLGSVRFVNRVALVNHLTRRRSCKLAAV